MTASLGARAAVVRKEGASFHLESIALDDPRPDELVVRIVASGICHTDLSTRDGLLPFGFPAVLGHEGSGVVEAVGSGVTGLEPGDHVVLSGAFCGTCPTCLDGRVVYCPSFPKLSRAGRRPDGSATMFDAQGEPLYGIFVGQSSFSTHVIVRAVNVVKVPETLPLELLGPLGCGVMTGAGAVQDTLRPEPGSTVAVFGLGGVGMSAVAAARIAGCGKVIAVDVNPARRELALEIGATDVVDAANDDVVQEIRRRTGQGVDYSIEASGVAAVGRIAVESTQGQGTTLLLGAPAFGSDFSVPWFSILSGRTVRGAIMGGSDPRIFIPRVSAMIGEGIFPLEKLVKYFDFDEIDAAVDALERGEVVKPIIRMPAQAHS
ncbi:NAD(P)-dependent alcohol dehydrogenase [Nocardia sp. alder85J]|uniref:NAD(P)-dependent alcohol dehydrogenase n=1 Tax=Nocardia sp. alder85J TaxID=2862949 RepID=UPI001CD37CF8|nr:NAD(P)-dependent alcohol dehydrogenase [Nocardia sp. alder85J]MCX4095617.1 NAD(P)-dependent alcohol dehydrogenase [Nocardia sp. alder85J]